MIKKTRFMLVGLVSFLLTLSLGISVAGASIEFSGISEKQVVTGIQILNLNIQVPAGEEIENVKIYLEEDIICETVTGPYTYPWDTTQLNDGIYTLRAVVETLNDIGEARRVVRVQNHKTPYGDAVYMWDFEAEPRGWGGDPDLTAELSSEYAFEGNYSAKYSGAYKYTTICKDNTRWGTHSGMSFSEISPNTKYYIQAWVKIDEIATEHFDLNDLKIKLNVMIRNASNKQIQRVDSVMAYDFSKMGTWQKLCVEFETHPDAAFFYLRIETIGPTSELLKPDKTIDIELYLDEVKIIEVTELTVQNEVMAFPNPFTDDVRFAYFLSEDTQIKAVIYDEVGRRVFETIEEAPNSGYNEIVWDGCDNNGESMSSGIYMCVISQKRNDIFVPIITGKLIKKG